MDTARLRQQSIIGLAAATRFSSGILMGTALGFYIGQNGGSDLAAALIYAAFFAGQMLFAPVWGAVADVTGRRRAVLAATGLGATVAILPLALTSATWAQIGLRGLYAVFAAAFPPVMLAIVSARGGADSRGRSVGFYNSARAVGFTGGQAAAGALLGFFLPRNLFFVIAGLSLVSTVAVLAVADSGPKPSTKPTLSEVLSIVRRRLLPEPEDRAHLRTNGLGWLYVALALRNVSVLGIMSLMPVYLPQSLGLSEFWMGVLLAINPAGQSVFMLLFGRLSDATGRKRLIVLGMAGSAGFSLVAAAASIPSSNTVQLAIAAVAFVLIAASFSAMIVGALAFIGDVAPPERESELLGLRLTAKGIGGVLGPVLVGGLALFVDRNVAFVVGAVPGLIATVLVGLKIVETHRVPIRQAAAGDD